MRRRLWRLVMPPLLLLTVSGCAKPIICFEQLGLGAGACIPSGTTSP